MRVVVSYQNSMDRSFFKDFTVEIRDYCVPSQLTKTSAFEPADIVYTVNDPAIKSEFTASWTTVPLVCNLSYIMTVTPTPQNPGLIVLDQNSSPMRVTVGTTDLLHETGNENHGSYVVEVRAWADNNHDTGFFEELTIEVRDPCMNPTLLIDNSVFKYYHQELTLEQFVFYDALYIEWTDAIVTEDFVGNELCGPLTHSVWN